MYAKVMAYLCQLCVGSLNLIYVMLFEPYLCVLKLCPLFVPYLMSGVCEPYLCVLYVKFIIASSVLIYVDKYVHIISTK